VSFALFTGAGVGSTFVHPVYPEKLIWSMVIFVGHGDREKHNLPVGVCTHRRVVAQNANIWVYFTITPNPIVGELGVVMRCSFSTTNKSLNGW